MRISIVLESEAAFHLGFGKIAMSMLPSVNFDSIQGITDFPSVKIMVKDVLAELGFIPRTNDRQSFRSYISSLDLP